MTQHEADSNSHGRRIPKPSGDAGKVIREECCLYLLSEATLPYAPEIPMPIRETQCLAIIKTDFLTDRLRMYYCCARLWRTTAEPEVLEVAYGAITKETDDCRTERFVGGPYLVAAGGPDGVTAD